MKFVFTPQEAQKVAANVARYFKRHKLEMKCEKAAWDDAPLKTTLCANKAGLTTLVEAQGVLSYTDPIKDFALWLSARRYYAEFYIATTVDSNLQHVGILQQMKKDGVGLLVVDTAGQVTIGERPRNPALTIVPEPTLPLGRCKTEILDAVNKFNEVNRKDGLRDMCEIVERETEKLGAGLIRKGWVTISETAFKKLDWSGQINYLESSKGYNSCRTPIIPDPLKADLHSFRGARNLLNHKVPGKREDARRQKQFAERMMQGPRLTSELLSLQRKVR